MPCGSTGTGGNSTTRQTMGDGLKGGGTSGLNLSDHTEHRLVEALIGLLVGSNHQVRSVVTISTSTFNANVDASESSRASITRQLFPSPNNCPHVSSGVIARHHLPPVKSPPGSTRNSEESDRDPLARKGPRPMAASLRPFPALPQSPTGQQTEGN